MNSYQRTLAALKGQPVDTTPVMLHNFMMAARENGVSMAQFRRNAKLAAQCFIRAVEKYHYDAVLMDIDTATLAGALGAFVDYPENEPARAISGCLKDLDRVYGLKSINLAANSHIQVWLETVSRLVEHFGKEIAVRGNCDQAPFSLAALLRSTDQWLMDLTDPAKESQAFLLLDHCFEASAEFIRLMAETGAHIVSNGDSIAGPDLISPRYYRKFAFPYEKRLVEIASALNLPYVLHICGNTTRILTEMVETGAHALELDFKTNENEALQALNGLTTLIGTLDPVSVVAFGTMEQVNQKSRELLTLFKDTPRFILNAGCAIPPETPSENIHAMVKSARSFNKTSRVDS